MRLIPPSLNPEWGLEVDSGFKDLDIKFQYRLWRVYYRIHQTPWKEI